jgi:hypothetical protein
VAVDPWRMFLSDGSVARARFGRSLADATLPANCPHGSTTWSSLAHGCSFRLLATPEQLSSPKWKSVGPTAAPPLGQVVSPCLSTWVALAWPGTAWDSHRSVWLTIVSRRSHQSPRRAAATNRNVCCGGTAPSVLQPVRGLGTPPRPKRDSSRTILAWPLRRRPLPDDAGCLPLLAESSSKDFRTGTAPRG